MSPGYSEFFPGVRLARQLECYWSLEVRDGIPGHRVLPDGCVDILFSKQNGEALALTVVGLMTTPLAHTVQPGKSFFGVRFRPAMASAFIPEVAALIDQTEPLETFWGAQARVLFDELAECRGAEGMIGLIERHLRPLEPPDALERALCQFSSTDLPAAHVASSYGMSLRHFRRGCHVRSGVSPKLLSRIIRFRRAVERIRRVRGAHAQPNWAQFAVACGYYDQAHFIREFQEFAGVTPGHYIQSHLPEHP